MEEARKVQQGLLFNSCEKGDIEEVKEIVESNKAAGEDWNHGGFHNGRRKEASISWLIDAKCETYWTPILFAARNGHLAVVEYLAGQGAKLESTSTYNAIHAACFG